MQTAVRCLAWRTGMIGGGGLDDEATLGQRSPVVQPARLDPRPQRPRTSEASVPFDLTDNRLI
jgi:hypothetical protein